MGRFLDLFAKSGLSGHDNIADVSIHGIIAHRGDDMTRRNDQGREIWFTRFAWSYMPAHWKGVVYPMAIIAAIGPFVALAISYDDDLIFIPLLIGWALAMWLCERHSPSRR